MASTQRRGNNDLHRSLDQEEKLIEFVRNHSYIYDKTEKDYKDTEKKNNAFRSIGEELGLTAEDAEKLWTSLRNQYSAYLRKLENPTGSGTKNKIYYRHANTMSFYQPHYKPYKSFSNIQNEDEASLPEAPENNTQDTCGNNVRPGNLIDVTFTGFDDYEIPPEVMIHRQTKQAISTILPQKLRTGRKRKSSDEFEDKLLSVLEDTGKTADEYDHFGAYIAGKLRAIKNQNKRVAAEMQLELQKIISETELKLLEGDELATSY